MKKNILVPLTSLLPLFCFPVYASSASGSITSEEEDSTGLLEIALEASKQAMLEEQAALPPHANLSQRGRRSHCLRRQRECLARSLLAIKWSSCWGKTCSFCPPPTCYYCYGFKWFYPNSPKIQTAGRCLKQEKHDCKEEVSHGIFFLLLCCLPACMANVIATKCCRHDGLLCA